MPIYLTERRTPLKKRPLVHLGASTKSDISRQVLCILWTVDALKTEGTLVPVARQGG